MERKSESLNIAGLGVGLLGELVSCQGTASKLKDALRLKSNDPFENASF